MLTNDIKVELLQDADVDCASQLIRRNLRDYEEQSSVLAATFRRLSDLRGAYKQKGSMCFVAKDMSKKEPTCIGFAGIGSFHGLPFSEGVAEIRDLVVEEEYRGQGIGNQLLERCLSEIKAFGYHRVYLEATPKMQHAQQLFIRNGFRAVTEGGKAEDSGDDTFACYFILQEI
ncbi:MAG: GNAT family N-acetyltransferase [Bdellovibrionota bacterium]